MTIREWKALNLPIEWAIYDRSYEDFQAEDEYPFDDGVAHTLTPADMKRREAFYEQHGGEKEWWLNKTLNLNAPRELGDGEYDCCMGYDVYRRRREGIVIQDGLFVPRPTAECIYELVWRGECHNSDDWTDRIRERYRLFFQDGKSAEANALSNGYQIPSQPGDPIHARYLEKLEWQGEYFVAIMGS